MTDQPTPNGDAVRRPAIMPWQAEPYRLWSLLDMRVIDVSVITNGACNLAVAAGQSAAIEASRVAAAESMKQVVDSIATELRARDIHLNVTHNSAVEVADALRETLRPKILETVGGVEDALKDAGLPQRFRDKIRRAKEEVSADRFNGPVASALFTEIIYDLFAELAEPMFLYIEQDKRRLYELKAPFGEHVAQAFPDSTRDVAAAARCLALDEWTACVFHCMRVLEHGLRRVAGHFSVPFAVDSWHKVLVAIEDGITRLRNQPNLTDDQRKEITLYSEAAAQFRYFKDAWRNHVSHGREHYDERDAARIYDHVRDFMQHMAKAS